VTPLIKSPNCNQFPAWLGMQPGENLCLDCCIHLTITICFTRGSFQKQKEFTVQVRFIINMLSAVLFGTQTDDIKSKTQKFHFTNSRYINQMDERLMQAFVLILVLGTVGKFRY
jgi:hypothetical protein